MKLVLRRGFFWCRIFFFFFCCCCWAGLTPPPPITRFPQAVSLGEGVGQSIDGGGNNQHKSSENVFDKMGNTRGVIQGNNSAGHCFILRDLIPMSILK